MHRRPRHILNSCEWLNRPRVACFFGTFKNGSCEMLLNKNLFTKNDKNFKDVPRTISRDDENFLRSNNTLGSSNSTSDSALSHVDSLGQAKMIDVGSKTPSERCAVAEARVWLGPEVFTLVQKNSIKKGDVLAVARIAGIIGAKATSNLIPLCHPLPLTHISVDTTLIEEDHSVKIIASAKTVGVTGVEMEALTAASVAALTIYDMCKAVSHAIEIGGIRLLAKKGGKKNFKLDDSGRTVN